MSDIERKMNGVNLLKDANALRNIIEPLVSNRLLEYYNTKNPDVLDQILIDFKYINGLNEHTNLSSKQIEYFNALINEGKDIHKKRQEIRTTEFTNAINRFKTIHNIPT